MTIRGYQDLVVWQRSVDLALAIYQASESFPTREIYDLSAQLRRAAVSIPSNIAEGHGREHLGDYLHHLSIANGSLMEQLETQIIIAARQGFLSAEIQSRILPDCGEVGRLLAGLIRSPKRRQNRSRT